MAYLLNGQPININSEYIREDGVRYENLRDASVRTKLGVTQNSDPDPFDQTPEQSYDQRFYWGVNNPKSLEDSDQNNEVGIYVNTSMGLKSQWIAQVKDIANKMLAQTDWMVIRKAERGIEIDEETAAIRAAIIDECNRLESEISSCKSVEKLIEVVSAQNWGD